MRDVSAEHTALAWAPLTSSPLRSGPCEARAIIKIRRSTWDSYYDVDLGAAAKGAGRHGRGSRSDVQMERYGARREFFTEFVSGSGIRSEDNVWEARTLRARERFGHTNMHRTRVAGATGARRQAWPGSALKQVPLERCIGSYASGPSEDSCRVCQSSALTKVIDLGEQYLQAVIRFRWGGKQLPLRKVPTSLVRCDPMWDEKVSGSLADGVHGSSG